MAHSLPPAALAELYRSLGRDGSELPTTARHLASKLHSANVDGASAEAVTAVFEDVDALSSAKPTRSTDAMVTECVRRLRASGDGGEAEQNGGEGVMAGDDAGPLEDAPGVELETNGASAKRKSVEEIS